MNCLLRYALAPIKIAWPTSSILSFFSRLRTNIASQIETIIPASEEIKIVVKNGFDANNINIFLKL